MDKQELTLDLIEELENEYSEQKEITIEIHSSKGTKEATLMIDLVFSPKKIKDCLYELLDKIERLQEYQTQMKEPQSIYQAWLVLLIIKHFSSLEIPEEFTKQIAVLGQMLKANILFQIFEEFPTSEIEKVSYELNYVVGELNIRLETLIKSQSVKE